MFSYILLFFSAVLFLSQGSSFKVERKIYSLLTTSALFSYSILGLISIILISLNQSRFPIISLSIIIFLLTIFFNKNYLKEYLKIKKFLLLEAIKITKYFRNSSQKISLIIIIFLIFLITISSWTDKSSWCAWLSCWLSISILVKRKVFYWWRLSSSPFGCWRLCKFIIYTGKNCMVYKIYSGYKLTFNIIIFYK